MPEKIGEIKVEIYEDSIKWDVGEFSLPDVNFWLDVVKSMVIEQITGRRNVTENGKEAVVQ